jgi:hypothetical protein
MVVVIIVLIDLLRLLLPFCTIRLKRSRTLHRAIGSVVLIGAVANRHFRTYLIIGGPVPGHAANRRFKKKGIVIKTEAMLLVPPHDGYRAAVLYHYLDQELLSLCPDKASLPHHVSGEDDRVRSVLYVR